MSRSRTVYMDYQEAQTFLPWFRYLAKSGPWAEVRREAKELVKELELVRPMDYLPLRGKQMFLTETQYAFLEDIRESLRMG